MEVHLAPISFRSFHVKISYEIENTILVPIGDDLSYNEWFPKHIERAKKEEI